MRTTSPAAVDVATDTPSTAAEPFTLDMLAQLEALADAVATAARSEALTREAVGSTSPAAETPAVLRAHARTRAALADLAEAVAVSAAGDAR